MSFRRFLPSFLLLAALVSITSGCEEELFVKVDPMLVVEPAEIDLGDVVIGLSARTELVLKNSGDTALEITSAAPDDALGGEFSLTGVESQLAPGQSLPVILSFVPTSVGERRGELIFRTNSQKTPEVRIPVKARGVEPALIANPALIDFGRVVIGRTASATVTLTNQSDRSVEVVRATLETGTSAEFAPNVARTMLAPGATLELTARYTPVDLGLDEGRVVVIDSSARPESLGIRVRGTGVDADIQIEPARLEFSGLYVGQEQTKPFVIRNIGDRAHLVTEIAFASTSSSGAGELSLLAGTLPLNLDPGAAQTVDVRYRPVDAAADSDRVRVASTGLSAPGFVEVVGNADLAPAPVIEVTPATLDFGSVEVGMSRPLIVRIVNIGTADLIITRVEVSPAGAPYTLTNQPMPSEVFAPRDSRDVTVTYAPPAVGPTAAASVVISSSDPARPTVTVPLTGEGTTGAVPIIFVSPNPLDFGRVPRGVPASRSVLVRNDGSAPLVLGQVRLTNDAGGRFRLPAPPAAGTQLNPAQTLNFNLEYSDNGVVATYTGTLEIASNDPARPTVAVSLRAQTEPPPPAITDIAVAMTWTSMHADVDLHLVSPGRSFFNTPGDCCFCNSNPDWGVGGQPQDDPFLDRDDLDGPGPENINLTQAASGDYQVVAHFFDDYGGGATDARVQVRLRGTVVADQTRNLSNNQRWVVGTIHWDAATRSGTFTRGIIPPLQTLLRLCL
ncbi:MAG: choice-of-anchor D domain-containing protein [Deltaproteobacteria bacterium]|nr:choice-of-anchor D domain-containing protein [Deltaproteobacteria bacterium]